MSAILTSKARVDNAKHFLYRYFEAAPSEHYMYFFAGRTYPWADETSPDLASGSYGQEIQTKRDIVYIKRIDETSGILVVPRFDWATGTIYTEYSYDLDLSDKRNWLHLEQPFYVINSADKVYKCISNNGGVASTAEPTLVTDDDTFTTADGYVWKYMYSIATAIGEAYLNSVWIPVPDEVADKDTSQTTIETNAVATIGSIDNIKVTAGGTGYTTAIVSITGDGSGAVGVATITTGVITNITMTTAGTGYTYADISIVGDGSGFTGVAQLAPTGGHGSNAVDELGAFYVMLRGQFDGNEVDKFPTSTTFRQVGILKDPTNAAEAVLTGADYSYFITLGLNNVTGTFDYGEEVYGGTSEATGKVFKFNDDDGIEQILLYDVRGTFDDSAVPEDIYGQDSGTIATIDTAGINTNDDVDTLSGTIVYTENITVITRSDIQIETFNFTIEF